MKKGRFFLSMILAAIVIVSAFSGCSLNSDKNVATESTATTITASTTAAATTAVITTSPVTQQTATTAVTTAAVTYQNTRYGFSFNLPDSWKGYSIATDKWEGVSLLTSTSGNITETGPIINIRHPLWTSVNPRQDIPVMVFTLAQWASLQKEEFNVGAAPIPPSELGRNTNYVFALPARYNFAFLTGFEEVETILAGNSLQPNEDITPV